MLDGMANVEEDRPSVGGDLRMAARVTGIAAIVLGAAELLSWVVGFGMTETAVETIGGDAFMWVLHVLWILELVATAVVAGGLIVGWRQAPLLWTPGIGAVALGLVLHWGWWAVDRFTDVWHWGRFTGVDPSDPDYVWTVRASAWVDGAVGVVTIALLVSGGIRLLLLRRRVSE
jgi:hypothetical protein